MGMDLGIALRSKRIYGLDSGYCKHGHMGGDGRPRGEAGDEHGGWSLAWWWSGGSTVSSWACGW